MHRPRVVVGVMLGQPTIVVSQAAAFAERFRADLVCAFVDATRYTVDECNGRVTSLPLDPELSGRREELFDPALRSRLSAVLAGRDVLWSTRALAGDPAEELDHLARTIDASLIVVGARSRFGSDDSVAGRLARRQRRPVVEIPVHVTVEAVLP